MSKSDTLSKRLPWFRETELYTSADGSYHTYRIPAITVALDDTILAFCEARKNISYDWGEIHIGLRRSKDNGSSWSPMQVVVSHGEDTAGNPCVVVDRDTGVVWLMYSRNNNTVYVCKSTDNGKSWSKPQNVTKGVKGKGWTWYGTGPGHGVQLQNGRLVIPSYHGEEVRHHPIYNQSHTVYSDDHGETWQIGGILGPGVGECEATEMGAGELYMTMRNSDSEFKARLSAKSTDGGDSWSELSEVNEILDPSCMGSVMTSPGRDSKEKDMLIISCPTITIRRPKFDFEGKLRLG